MVVRLYDRCSLFRLPCSRWLRVNAGQVSEEVLMDRHEDADCEM